MKIIIKIFVFLIGLLVLLSIYSHTLHPVFFHGDNQPIEYDVEKYNEALAISFKSGEETLKGHIVTNASKDSKVPLIIFATGSGEGSYATNYIKFVDYFFEENFALDSLAILYFDKRGVGSSEGNWFEADYYQRAEDVKAAAEYASGLDFVDKERIMVIGHSQGGWIAQLCLALYPDLFHSGVSLAGPTFSVKQQLSIEFASEIKCKNNITQQEAMEKGISKEKWVARMMRLFPLAEGWVQYNNIKNYEAAPYIKKIDKPFLFVFAENDALVYLDDSIDALNEVFDNKLPDNITVKVIENATHSFRAGDLCQHYSTEPTEYREQLRTVLRNWVQ